MKSFIVGIGMFTGILSIVYVFSVLFSMLGFSSETIRTLFIVGMLLFVAKPFGELTLDIYRRK
jgi:hypothetical protein